MRLDNFDPISSILPWKLFSLVSLAAFLIIFCRLWNIQNIPPVITIDEASIGINAKSMLETGRDEFGISYPLFFKAFGEYKSPIFIYSTIPAIKIFGLNLYSLRLTAALWGILTIIATTLLTWELTKNKTVTFISLINIGLIPWHFQLSHLALEVVTLPFFLTLALYFLFKAKNSGSSLFTLIAAAFFGLMIYTYPTARLLAPFYVLLALCLLLDRPFQRLLFFSVFALIVAPFIIASIQNPALVLNRYGEISIFSKPDQIKLFLSNYLSYLSPNFTLFKGSNDLLFSTQHVGSIFVSFVIPLIVGLGYLIKRSRHDLTKIFLLICLLTFPLAAALTFDNQPHLLRTANALPFLVVTASIGAWYLLKALPKVVVTFFITLFIIEVGLYLYDFNVSYPKRVKNNIELKQVTVPNFNRENLLKFYKQTDS